jgi:sugar phosphate isomerase/epimerase
MLHAADHSAPLAYHQATCNGQAIHDVRAGAGDPVVLLHGRPATWYQSRGQVDRATVGLTFNTRHDVPGQTDPAPPAAIPGDRIIQVRLADATRVPTGATRTDDLLQYRLPPGKGAFPIPELVRTVRATGGISAVGVELFSDVMDALPAEEAGRRVRRSLRAVIDPPAPGDT